MVVNLLVVLALLLGKTLNVWPSHSEGLLGYTCCFLPLEVAFVEG